MADPTTTTTTTTTAAPVVTTFGLQILTPLTKTDRVSRQMNPVTFVATPGIWAMLNNDGTISNVVADTPALINKLVIGSRSGNKYESNDTSHGRITTMESIGIRCRVSNNLYSGTINKGDQLIVSTDALTLGQLVSVAETSETGWYEVVARCEEINDIQGYMIFRTVSPELVHLT